MPGDGFGIVLGKGARAALDGGAMAVAQADGARTGEHERLPKRHAPARRYRNAAKSLRRVFRLGLGIQVEHTAESGVRRGKARARGPAGVRTDLLRTSRSP